MQERLAAQYLVVPLNTPEEFTAFVAAESKRWGDAIAKANIRVTN